MDLERKELLIQLCTKLLEAKIGDRPRIIIIKKRAEEGKILYQLDKKYLERMAQYTKFEALEPTTTPPPKQVQPEAYNKPFQTPSEPNYGLCSNCGNPINNKFCPKCGSPTNLDNLQPSPESTPPPKLTSNITNTPNHTSSKKRIFLAVISFFVLLLGSMILFGFQGPLGMFAGLIAALFVMFMIIKETRKRMLMIFGIILLLFSGLAFFFPVNDAGMTVFDLKDVCKGPLGMFAGVSTCSLANSIVGIATLSAIIGLILTIVGFIKKK